MGVAGQIFAARVAIGLAVPSPKALSQTGQMLGSFSAKMYKNLNQQHLKAASERTQITLNNLQNTNKKITEFTKRQDREMMSAAQASLNKTQKMFSGEFANKSRQIQGMQTQMKKLAPTVAPKLFANLSKDMSAAQKYQKVMRNFINLSREERKIILEATKVHLQDAKATAAAAVAHAKANKEMAEYAKSKVEDAQRLENSYQQMIIVDRDMHHQHLKNAEEDKQLNKERIENSQKLQEAIEQERKLTEDLAAAQQQLKDAVNKAINTAHSAFNEVLRDALSILTGFYYKLNESTMALAEFERELLNANSVFGQTRDELFRTSQTIVQFGQEFGLAMDNGAKGLYQLASAGLSADEAMSVLPHTLKLSMAVQGDHNTISKLTAQTLFGFGMSMDEAGLLTDKFAHAIQKSLIEYEDLTSAIKFALPFFTATGQSIDQLLGSLQILTNRALEAGIAGRGLRQALAEFAESAEDNAAVFRTMGIEILNAQGEMMQLTEIAQRFADVVGPETASNTELLTALIQDLNVRGATAFIHLVQNAEEFKQAVEDTTNAGGELEEMVRIQNESIQAQIQILKNNVEAIFFMREANDDGTESLNEFHQGVLDVIASLRGLIVTEQDGKYVLTAFGRDIRKMATEAVKMFGEAVHSLVNIIKDFTKEGFLNLSMLKAYFIPVKAVLGVIQALGPGIIKLIVWWKVLNAVIPISTLLTLADEIAIISNTTAKVANTAATTAQAGAEVARAEATRQATAETLVNTGAMGNLGGAIARFGKALLNPYVLLLAVTALVAALVVRTIHWQSAWEGMVIGTKEFLNMLSFAVSPLTELFNEWGDATERALGYYGTDNRASMIGIFQEIGALIATIVYGVSYIIAEIARTMATWAAISIEFILGDDAKRTIAAIETIAGGIEWGAGRIDAAKEIPERTLATFNQRGNKAQSGVEGYGQSSQGMQNLTTVGAWTAAGAAGGSIFPVVGTTAGAVGGFAIGVSSVIGGEASRRGWWANGGTLPHGYANGGPILVGERGPELIVPPRMGGQVLNTDRTRNLLRGQQSGMAGGNGMVQTLIVSNIVAQSSTSQNSKIAIDSFAGVA